MEALRLFVCVLSVLVALLSERLLVLAAFSQAMDGDFTFTLPAGRKECFYQTMKKDASLEIEYQVTNTYIYCNNKLLTSCNHSSQTCVCSLLNL